MADQYVLRSREPGERREELHIRGIKRCIRLTGKRREIVLLLAGPEEAGKTENQEL